jgi:hydroxymethylpyrimidine/phosphomethylpyrimidine kinase
LVRPAIILSIAGSDCGGGAGIQADIKSISANGGYAATVITAITAQNTIGVQNVFPLAPKIVKDQLNSVFNDFTINSVKIGMLHDVEIIKTVADVLNRYKPKFVVLDPVMVSSSGNQLTNKDAISVMIEKLFPCCSLITPNVDEIIELICSDGSGTEMKNYVTTKNKNKKSFLELIKESFADIFKLGVKNVLITGVFDQNFSKFTKNNLFDVFVSNKGFSVLGKEKIITKNTHGTGCSLSSTIATKLALGEDMINAIVLSQKYVHKCILEAKNLEIGHGKGPLNHFFTQFT